MTSRSHIEPVTKHTDFAEAKVNIFVL